MLYEWENTVKEKCTFLLASFSLTPWIHLADREDAPPDPAGWKLAFNLLYSVAFGIAVDTQDRQHDGSPDGGHQVEGPVPEEKSEQALTAE